MDNSVQQSSSWKDRARVVLRAGKALLLTVIALLAGGGVGFVLAGTVDTADEYKFIAGALGISYILTTFEKFLAQAPHLWRWLRTGSGDGLSTFTSFTFLLVTTAVAALLAKDPESPPPSQLPQLAANQVLFVKVDGGASRRQGSNESLLLIPFEREAGGCDPSTSDFKAGARLSTGAKELIAQLTRGLAECGSPDRPVRLQIRGFASSQPFDADCASNGDSDRLSRRLNRDIANARAQAVVEEIAAAEVNYRAQVNSQGTSRGITVEPIIWPTFEAMKAGQRWNDEDARGYRTERAILTRRAEIVLIDSGDCELLLPLPPSSALTQTARREAELVAGAP